MGLLSILKKMKKDEKEARILVLGTSAQRESLRHCLCEGLDNAGKTTILKKLSEEEPCTT